MNVLVSANVTKKDLFNMMAGSTSFKSVLNQPIEVKGCALVEDVNKETGEATLVSYIVDKSGDVYGGNSSVISDLISLIAEMIDSDEPVTVMPITFKSASGRDCITLNMV